ncbi:MAG: beta-lactamase family protein [Rhizobiaceae bacterium]|nr:beta-lactamase family protein [Rhizobiaceae bacterium]
MTSYIESVPNRELTVGTDRRQNWNRPENRRHGFHNAHLIFRRSLAIRAGRTSVLADAPDAKLASRVAESGLTNRPTFSALAIVEEGRLLYGKAAPDFALERPHSIQSITKMHMHLIAGALIEEGVLDPEQTAGHYLPWLGSGYHGARVRDLLDMNVANDFSEDYSDPGADCYREEEALGWRLPPDERPEMTLAVFACGITGTDLKNRKGYVEYKSANTDALTLIAAGLTDLPARLAAITDAAGYAGGFHVSLSPEGLPALSGGGCLSVLDLARFGLLFARGTLGIDGRPVGSGAFLQAALASQGPPLSRSRPWQRYAGHLMTDGRTLGHARYGGQYLMVNPATGRVAAFLSVLDNDSGYDETYMARIVEALSAFVG